MCNCQHFLLYRQQIADMDWDIVKDCLKRFKAANIQLDRNSWFFLRNIYCAQYRQLLWRLKVDAWSVQNGQFICLLYFSVKTRQSSLRVVILWWKGKQSPSLWDQTRTIVIFNFYRSLSLYCSLFPLVRMYRYCVIVSVKFSIFGQGFNHRWLQRYTCDRNSDPLGKSSVPLQ